MLARSTMKVLYVLVSSESDYYYEQALLSVLSLKNVMPTSQISMLVDDVTDKNLVGNRSKIKEYIDEYKVVDLDESMSPMIRSRFLKTSMRNLIDGDFLYVDTDTIWIKPLNESDFTENLMAADDAFCDFEEHPNRDMFIERIRQIDENVLAQRMINGGVMYVEDVDATRLFFKEWHCNWLKSKEKGVFTDQESLEITRQKYPLLLKNLPVSYNAQMPLNLGNVNEANLIHYFASSFGSHIPHDFYRESFWKLVRSKTKTEDLLEFTKNPMRYFEKFPFRKCVSDEQFLFLQNDLTGFLFDLSRSKKKAARLLVCCMEKGCRMICSMYRKK